MRIFIVFIAFMMSFAPLSHAETLSAVNPAETDSSAKAQGASINEICPMNYHCNVANDGTTRCLPNDQNVSIKGSESCFSVAKLCKKYLGKIAEGKELNKSEAKRFPYYCS